MSMTARDLIIASMRTARAIDPLETPDANEIALGLQELNGLLETWDAEKLTPYSSMSVEVAIPSGQSSYTISSAVTSDIVTERPIAIQGLQRLDGDNWIPLSEYSYSEYSQNMVGGGSGTPSKFVYNPSFPEAQLILLPKPYQGITLRISTLVRVGDLTLDSVISLPPGYVPAIQWDLARILAPIYHIPETQDIEREAYRRKGIVKRLNDKPVHLTSGMAPIGRGGNRGFDMIRGI